MQLTGARVVERTIKVMVAAQVRVIVAMKSSLLQPSSDSAVAGSISVWRRASIFQRYAIHCGAFEFRVLRNRREYGIYGSRVRE